MASEGSLAVSAEVSSEVSAAVTGESEERAVAEYGESVQLGLREQDWELIWLV